MAPTGSGPAIGGEGGRIEVITGAITIWLGTGFASEDVQRVLLVVRELT